MILFVKIAWSNILFTKMFLVKEYLNDLEDYMMFPNKN